MVQLIRILVTLLFSVIAFASTDQSQHYYNQLYLGEQQSDQYFGTHFPSLWTNPYSGQTSFREQKLDRIYFQNLYLGNIEEIEQYLNDEFSVVSACSVYELGQNLDYIRYLYRLISFSYLYETLVDLKIKASVLGEAKACAPYLKEQLKKSCSPKSSDFKSYFSTLLQVQDFKLSEQDLGQVKALNKEKVLELYNEVNTADISSQRIRFLCEQKNGSCSNISLAEYTVFLKQSCAQDLEQMKLICNEEDNLLGLSNIPMAYELLLESNVVNALGGDKNAAACLRRYADVAQKDEATSAMLEILFPVIKQRLEKIFGSRYLQGRIFVPGAFKEFEMKGLKTILGSRPTKKVEEKVVAISKPTQSIPHKKIEVHSKINVIDNEAEKVAPVEAPKVEEKPKVEIKKTAFLSSAEVLESQGLSLTFVDMRKFKYDFIFSFKMLKELEEPLKAYTSLKALKEMKKHDKLGTKNGPVPLIFVKYLVDTNRHHGIYNMINTLGDEFHVFNDIDELNPYKSHLIKLLNDVTTRNRWQIIILENHK